VKSRPGGAVYFVLVVVQNWCMSSSFVVNLVHLVFSTKERMPLIDAEWQRDLHAYLGGCVRTAGCEVKAVGGVNDHVHLLLGLNATTSLATLTRDIKRASSIWASEMNPAFAWQTGYGAFSVSHSHRCAIESYIGHQAEHHETVSSKDELRALLAECGIEPDERFFV